MRADNSPSLTTTLFLMGVTILAVLLIGRAAFVSTLVPQIFSAPTTADRAELFVDAMYVLIPGSIITAFFVIIILEPLRDWL